MRYVSRDEIAGMLRRTGVVRTRDLYRLGVTKVDFERLVRSKQLVWIGRGIYASAAVDRTDDRALAAAALRVPRGVVCLTAAAQVQGLIDERPAAVWVAIDANAQLPWVLDLPVRFWFASKGALRLPTEEHTVEGVRVRVFSAAATVAHLILRRKRVGEDVAREALRRLLERDPAEEARVVDFAIRCRAAGAVKAMLTERG